MKLSQVQRIMNSPDSTLSMYEIDENIAIHIMGYHKITPDDSDDIDDDSVDMYTPFGIPVHKYHPHSNIDQALGVVYELKKKGYNFLIVLDDFGWFAEFSKNSMAFGWGSSTLAAAICKAALVTAGIISPPSQVVE